MESSNKLKKILIMFISIMVIGVIGYMILLKTDFIDALYMTVITISTVGYKEVADMDTQSKLFSMFLIFWGLGVVGYAFSSVVVMFVDGKIKEIWRGKRMDKMISQMSNHYIICGAGEIADVIIAQFIKEKQPYLLVDNRIDLIQEYQQRDIISFHGCPTSEQALINAGVQRCAGLLAVGDKDVDNIVTVLTVRGLCPNLYIASIVHEDHADEKLKKVGANKTLSTCEIGGRRLAAIMTKREVINFLDLITHTGDMDLSLEEIDVREGSELAGITIREAQVSQKTGLIILAIKQPNNSTIFNPTSAHLFAIGDRLLVMGEDVKLTKLQALAGWKV